MQITREKKRGRRRANEKYIWNIVYVGWMWQLARDSAGIDHWPNLSWFGDREELLFLGLVAFAIVEYISRNMFYE